MIRGVKTTEFWLQMLAKLFSIIMVTMIPEIEVSAENITEQGIAAVPPQVWAALGGEVSAGLYAIGRGIAKGLGGSK